MQMNETQILALTEQNLEIIKPSDIDEYKSFCVLNLSENRTLNTANHSCTARGCVWDSNTELYTHSSINQTISHSINDRSRINRFEE
jgi:hypothetical protein